MIIAKGKRAGIPLKRLSFYYPLCDIGRDMKVRPANKKEEH